MSATSTPTYRLEFNGILLPDGLGSFGQYLDSSWIGSLSLITGALPAQYGLRTAGVDITTAKFDNVGEIGTYMGSRHTSNSSIQYGGTAGSTEYFISGRYLQTALGIENTSPALNALHDRTTQDRSFGYISTIIDPTTRLSFIGGTAVNKFQILGTLPGQSSSIGRGITTVRAGGGLHNFRAEHKLSPFPVQRWHLERPQ